LNGAKHGFPSCRGTFDWLWSYHPPVEIPGGLVSDDEILCNESIDTKSPASLSIHTFTLNCAGLGPPPAETLMQLFRFGRKDGEPPAVIVANLQEICPLFYAFIPSGISAAVDTAAKDWANVLDDALGKVSGITRYKQVCVECLVGLLLIIWVREESGISTQPESYSNSIMACGFGGASNKGAVACSFMCRGLRLCVIDVHFAAGIGKADIRSENMAKMIETFKFGSHEKRNLFQHDLIIIAGDFNSRLHAACDQPLVCGNEINVSTISESMEKHMDELRAQRSSKQGAWVLLQEAPITFGPTYKFVPGTSDQDPVSSGAWTDRICWWARPSVVKAEPHKYYSNEEVIFSDHRAVLLDLDVWLDGTVEYD